MPMEPISGLVIENEPLNLPAVFDKDTARDIYESAVRRYIASRRAMIGEFVDRHFSMGGSVRLHRHAVGLDLVRAPYNVLASLGTIAKRGAATVYRAAGAPAWADALDRRNLFIQTKVGREIEWLLHSEWLQLPYAQEGGRWARPRQTDRDALIEAILADGRVQAHIAQMLEAIRAHADEAGFRERVTDAMTEYLGSRSAASDVTTSLFAAATGAALYHQFTPGMAALSGAIAGSIAKSAAVSGFSLGSWMGGVYYSIFSATTPPMLYAGVFAGLMVPAAALTAFAGVLADPVQRRLGLHQRRLGKMLDHLEASLLGQTTKRYVVRDHYVARLLDFADWSATLVRLATR